jgi:hypothetical protein
MSANATLVQAWLEPYKNDVRMGLFGDSVRLLISGPNTSGAIISLRRSPAEAIPFVWSATARSIIVDEHLVADVDETDTRWLSAADVVIRRSAVADSTSDALHDLYAGYPGCLVAGLIDDGPGYLVGTSSGWRARLIRVCSGPCADHEISLYASTVHSWMAAGRSLTELDAARIVSTRRHGAHRCGVRVSAGRVIPEAVRRVGS